MAATFSLCYSGVHSILVWSVNSNVSCWHQMSHASARDCKLDAKTGFSVLEMKPVSIFGFFLRSYTITAFHIAFTWHETSIGCSSLVLQNLIKVYWAVGLLNTGVISYESRTWDMSGWFRECPGEALLETDIWGWTITVLVDSEWASQMNKHVWPVLF